MEKYIKIINKIIAKKKYFTIKEEINISINDPLKLIIKLNEKFQQINKTKINVTLDITSFPRHELLIILYFLRHSPLVKKIRCLYVSPTSYGDWLSQGYQGSILVPFFDGPSTFEKKMALFVLTGFEVDRVNKLVQDTEPSAVFLAQTEPGTAPEFMKKNLSSISEMTALTKNGGNIFKIPGNNPFKCRDRILQLLKDQSEKYDFLVAPIGPKLGVLGLYLAYEECPIFRIIYPLTILYNSENYSKGCREIYEIVLMNDSIENK